LRGGHQTRIKDWVRRKAWFSHTKKEPGEERGSCPSLKKNILTVWVAQQPRKRDKPWKVDQEGGGGVRF